MAEGLQKTVSMAYIEQPPGAGESFKCCRTNFSDSTTEELKTLSILSFQTVEEASYYHSFANHKYGKSIVFSWIRKEREVFIDHVSLSWRDWSGDKLAEYNKTLEEKKHNTPWWVWIEEPLQSVVKGWLHGFRTLFKENKSHNNVSVQNDGRGLGIVRVDSEDSGVLFFMSRLKSNSTKLPAQRDLNDLSRLITRFLELNPKVPISFKQNHSHLWKLCNTIDTWYVKVPTLLTAPYIASPLWVIQNPSFFSFSEKTELMNQLHFFITNHKKEHLFLNLLDFYFGDTVNSLIPQGKNLLRSVYMFEGITNPYPRSIDIIKLWRNAGQHHNQYAGGFNLKQTESSDEIERNLHVIFDFSGHCYSKLSIFFSMDIWKCSRRQYDVIEMSNINVLRNSLARLVGWSL